MHGTRRRHVLIAMAGLLASPVQAAPASRKVDRGAAYLEQAFSHDLCTRGDRALHTLTKALGRKPVAAPR